MLRRCMNASVRSHSYSSSGRRSITLRTPDPSCDPSCCNGDEDIAALSCVIYVSALGLAKVRSAATLVECNSLASGPSSCCLWGHRCRYLERCSGYAWGAQWLPAVQMSENRRQKPKQRSIEVGVTHVHRNRL